MVIDIQIYLRTLANRQLQIKRSVCNEKADTSDWKIKKPMILDYIFISINK
jgi:hypothetical protein